MRQVSSSRRDFLAMLGGAIAGALVPSPHVVARAPVAEETGASTPGTLLVTISLMPDAARVLQA